MNPIRTYLDTSVFGGFFDKEFSLQSQKLFSFIRYNKITPLISDVLVTEILRASYYVQRLLGMITDRGAELLKTTSEIVRLQDAYLTAGIVTENYADDALHVAHATIAQADVIASWNFRHLVNPERIREFNGINFSHGYGMIVILAPSDIIKITETSHE